MHKKFKSPGMKQVRKAEEREKSEAKRKLSYEKKQLEEGQKKQKTPKKIPVTARLGHRNPAIQTAKRLTNNQENKILDEIQPPVFDKNKLVSYNSNSDPLDLPHEENNEIPTEECIMTSKCSTEEFGSVPQTVSKATTATTSHSVSNAVDYSFWTMDSSIKRDSLHEVQKVKAWLKDNCHIPDQFQLGAAKGQGDCFFDAMAQGLCLLVDNKGLCSVKSLRLLCDAYAKEPHNAWVKAAVIKDKDEYEQYLARIAFTVEEIETAEWNVRNDPAVWGRPDIEGRMICEEYNIQLHVIEVWEDESSHKVCVMEQLVDSNGSRSVDALAEKDYENFSVIHLVVYRNHFVPLLSNALFKPMQPQQLTQFEEYSQEFNLTSIREKSIETSICYESSSVSEISLSHAMDEAQMQSHADFSTMESLASESYPLETQKDQKQRLTAQEIKKYITLNGGHTFSHNSIIAISELPEEKNEKVSVKSVNLNNININEYCSQNNLAPPIKEAPQKNSPKKCSVTRKKEIGQWGEELVYEKLKKVNPEANIEWLNGANEQGLPHDIEVHYEEGKKKFYEVKTTVFSSSSTSKYKKASFSANQVEEMRKSRSDYSIFRVYNAETMKPEIMTISDPYQKLFHVDRNEDGTQIEFTPAIPVKSFKLKI